MQNLKLAEFFLTLSDLNKHLDILKQPLNSSTNFSPMEAFSRIKLSKDRKSPYIGINDLKSFMEDCQFSVEYSTLTMLIKLYDNQYQGKLNYPSFLRMVLSSENHHAGDKYLSIPPSFGDKGGDLHPEVEFGLARFFYKSSQFLKRMVQEPEFMAVLGRHDTFKILDKCRKGILDFENIREFFNEVSIRISDDEIIGILRLIDINDDGLITEGDFELFIRILRGDLNNFFNQKIFKSPAKVDDYPRRDEEFDLAYRHGNRSTAKKRVVQSSRYEMTAHKSREASPTRSHRVNPIVSRNDRIHVQNCAPAPSPIDDRKIQENVSRDFCLRKKESANLVYRSSFDASRNDRELHEGRGSFKRASNINRDEERGRGNWSKDRAWGRNESDYSLVSPHGKKAYMDEATFEAKQKQDEFARRSEAYRFYDTARSRGSRKRKDKESRISKVYKSVRSRSKGTARKEAKNGIGSGFRNSNDSKIKIDINPSTQDLGTDMGRYGEGRNQKFKIYTEDEREAMKVEATFDDSKINRRDLRAEPEKSIEKIRQRVKRSFGYDYGYSNRDIALKNQKEMRHCTRFEDTRHPKKRSELINRDKSRTKKDEVIGSRGLRINRDKFSRPRYDSKEDKSDSVPNPYYQSRRKMTVNEKSIKTPMNNLRDLTLIQSSGFGSNTSKLEISQTTQKWGKPFEKIDKENRGHFFEKKNPSNDNFSNIEIYNENKPIENIFLTAKTPETLKDITIGSNNSPKPTTGYTLDGRKTQEFKQDHFSTMRYSQSKESEYKEESNLNQFVCYRTSTSVISGLKVEEEPTIDRKQLNETKPLSAFRLNPEPNLQASFTQSRFLANQKSSKMMKIDSKEGLSREESQKLASQSFINFQKSKSDQHQKRITKRRRGEDSASKKVRIL